MLHALAMAGLAEAAEQMALMLAWGGLILAALSAVAAFSSRSKVAAGISIALTAGVTVLFMPWSAFIPLSPKELEDPDARYWVGAWRVLACGWVAVVLVVLTAGVVVYRSRKQGRET
jgi:hypothetical protein